MEGDIARIGTGGATGYVKLTQINKVFQKPEEASFIFHTHGAQKQKKLKGIL